VAETTTVADRQLAPGTPQIHLLAIGVGAYEFLPGGTNFQPTSPNLPQLTSPPDSAVALATRLYDELKFGPLQVGSVEMALSPARQNVDVGDGPKDVKVATRDNINDAFNNWLNRCNESTQNVGIFYFCGHGMRFTDMLLLPSDFGRSPANPTEKAVNFSGTYLNMARCNAATQIYFIDACGTWDPQFNMPSGQHGTPLLNTSTAEFQASAPRCAPIFYASEDGRQAFGSALAGQTPFVDLLFQGIFEGKCAVNQHPDWCIKPAELATKLLELADWFQQSGAATALPKVDIRNHLAAANRAVHRLAAPPKVELRLLCPTGTAGAVVFVEQNGTRVAQSLPLPGGLPLNIAVEPGVYQIVLNDPGTNQDLSNTPAFIQPPPNTIVVS
jgi:hypothetical protein